MASNFLVLNKNREYPWAESGSPDTLEFTASETVSEQIARLKAGKISFMVPLSGMTYFQYSDLRQTRSVQEIDPHIGYTFWLSPNAESEAFSTLGSRLWLSSLVSTLKLDFVTYAPYWQGSRQLYLNDGFARPTQTELDKVWTDIKSNAGQSPKRIRFLAAASFPFLDSIVALIRSAGVEVELVQYNSIQEFESLLKKDSFDLFQINNDFSSADVLENLLVTFSDSRPLIKPSAELSEYKSLLRDAMATQDPDTRHTILKNVGLRLLERGHVAPVAYRRNILFGNQSWEFSRWSMLFPDVRFWKISRNRDEVPR